MDSNLEEKRQLHEQRDRIEMEIVSEILSISTRSIKHKHKLESEHRQKQLIDKYMSTSRDLLALYEDNTIQQDDFLSPAGNTDDDETSISTSQIFGKFYTALNKLQDFYANDKLANEQIDLDELLPAAMLNPAHNQIEQQDIEEGEIVDTSNNQLQANPDATSSKTSIVIPERSLVEFTDEEANGRCLDLNQCYDAFLQVIKREEQKPDYLSFLRSLSEESRFTIFSRERKLCSAYKHYVESMLEYIRGFCRRAKPLFEFSELENEAHEEFLESWRAKTTPGWFRDTDRLEHDADGAPASAMVDIETYKSYDQLMELGLDCLKRELQVRGLKCGGTLDERAKRLWAVRGKSFEEIDNSLKAQPLSLTKKGKKKSSIDPLHLASIEAKISKYIDHSDLGKTIEATIQNVVRKQAQTADERNESDDDISDVNNEDDDDDDDDDDDNTNSDVIYNPKNFPLGWDGKPIPYWLYKLHGLNLIYTCEICGNATYKGPKAFQRHFAEWRHANGMRCLGIPNTAHFANITKIQDAISLWEKLKNEKQREQFQPLVDEEYEDSQGNVVNKKTYEDLKRQGLL